MNVNETNSKKSNFHKLLKKITVKNILKFIAVLIIIAVYALLFGRMYLAKDRGVMARYSPTEEYVLQRDDSTEILTQHIQTSMDEMGYYNISNLVFIPEINELQINVRYNNSTLKELKNHHPEYTLSSEPFVYTLVDDNGNKYELDSYIPKSNLIYNFRKLVFKNIDFESVQELHLEIAFAGDQENSPMNARFPIYDKTAQTIASDLKVKSNKADNFIE